MKDLFSYVPREKRQFVESISREPRSEFEDPDTKGFAYTIELKDGYTFVDGESGTLCYSVKEITNKCKGIK